jgi:cell division protein FtsB
MKIAMAFGASLLLFALFGDEHGVRAIIHARHDARVLSAQIAALHVENAAMRRRADALRTDPAMLEQTARETLGLVRPGEIVVVPHRRDSDRLLGR